MLKFDKNKIKINWNKNPIKMKLFLSFLTIKVERSKNHLGSSNGWTMIKGDNDLIIGGGIIKNIEYLDSLKYKSNLDNNYNDFVHPFHIFDILNKDGKDFFIEYYKDDIKDIIAKSINKVRLAKENVKLAIKESESIHKFLEGLNDACPSCNSTDFKDIGSAPDGIRLNLQYKCNKCSYEWEA